jgi:hypothetical protein
VGNSHLGESDEQRTAAVKAVRQVCEANVPTLIQGADSLHQVRVVLLSALILREPPDLLSSVGAACYRHNLRNSRSSLYMTVVISPLPDCLL